MIDGPMRRNITFKIAIMLTLLTPKSGIAQVVPDNTLPSNSRVTFDQNNIIIDGGTTVGRNLFHSFKEFSIPQGRTVYFKNSSLDINNIIERVTGASISNINGLIRADGTANLFLLNSNGIIFGPNARLDIGGSFLATTANILKFADGTLFNTIPSQSPILTISVPIGLGFLGNSGEIHVQNTGHDLTISSSNLRGFDVNNTPIGLQVKPGKVLGLMGGKITFEGGILTSSEGRIELGSINDGFVNLNPSFDGWNFSYENVNSFKDIQFSQKSLLNSSGSLKGIQIQGANIKITEGSVIWNQNQSAQKSDPININTSESVEISGILPNGINSGIFTETDGKVDGGDIGIFTKNLSINNGAQIAPLTFSGGKSGNVVIQASNSINLRGFLSINPTRNGYSGVNTITYSSGSGGDITVSTKDLTLEDGGVLSPFSNTLGNGGNLFVSAKNLTISGGSSVGTITFRKGKGGNTFVVSDVIKVDGESRIGPSSLSAATFGSGNAGNLTINASRLVVENGGRVDTASLASGQPGQLLINASNSIEVNGRSKFTTDVSQIDSSTTALDPSLQQRFRTPSVPSGSFGDLIINTGTLLVNGGAVSVKNEGNQNAGTLKVKAKTIKLDSGSITASTTFGTGGNVFLQSSDLQLKHGSTISATAGNSGNGGNITIDTDTLAILENSAVTANAFEGRGGNIKINAQGFFLSPDSRVTASSEKGIQGTVIINTPETGVKPVTQFPDAVRLTGNPIACTGQPGETTTALVNMGTGGIPQSPDDLITTNPGWQEGNTATPNQSIQKPLGAQSWRDNGDGTVRFVAEPAEAEVSKSESLCQSQEKKINE